MKAAASAMDMLHRAEPIHFVGIGGIGMSGIAEVLNNLGHQVQGSDLCHGDTIKRLRSLGIPVMIGHDADNLKDCKLLVVSSAINDDNPELLAARRQSIPVVKRAEMLAELMRFRFGIAVAGTHGKTTTTSLIASLMSEAGLDPTYVVGGKIEKMGSGAGLGNSDYLLVEADESDYSFLHLKPIITVVTNVDDDHLSTYNNDFEQLKQGFINFLLNLPFYGTVVACYEDACLETLQENVPRMFVSYGFDRRSDVWAEDLEAQDTRSRFTLHTPWHEQALRLQLNVPGRHNVLNAMAAICVAHELGIDRAEILNAALSSFSGIARRFQSHGEIKGPYGAVHLIDDYAHHPTELQATLDTVRTSWPGRRRVMIFQPHRYTRTHQLFDKFAQVLSELEVLIVVEVYAAGEPVIAGANSRALCQAIRHRGRLEPLYAETLSDAKRLLASVARDGDVVVTAGAGSISALAKDLAGGWSA